MKSITKILVSNIDIKDFRALMEKHFIKILEEKQTKHGPRFTVESDEEAIEEILIETHMEWDFEN